MKGFNDRNYVSVNAHEATHQWFGDLITARSNQGTWLQESFATYYAKLFMKSVYGADEYAIIMRNEVNSALAAGKKDNIPVVHSKSGSAGFIQKVVPSFICSLCVGRRSSTKESSSTTSRNMLLEMWRPMI